jgi:predicted RNA methylase
LGVESAAKERIKAFRRLSKYFDQRHRQSGDPDGGPYRLTALGAWATSRAAHVFYFFKAIGLHRAALFCDLGSGDGLVVCIASLFTRAIGIEVDKELCRMGCQAATQLGLQDRVRFVCADFRTIRIREADCLYIYPDKPPRDLIFLLDGWNGSLLVYGPHFPLKDFNSVQRLHCGGETLHVYRARTSTFCGQ